jgi:ABC-type sugar transport system substrate-binding protein
MVGASCSAGKVRRAGFRLAVISLLGVLLGGCDGGSRPAPVSSQTVPVGVPEVVVVLPATRSPEVNLWDLTLQAQAGREGRMLLTTVRPESEEATASRQAELVSEAVARGASAIIAVPGDPKRLAPALQSAREQGVPVVVLGGEIPIEGEPFPSVTTPPLDRIVDELIAKAREVAKLQGVDPDGPATIIAPEPLGDQRITPRVEALQKALKRLEIPIPTIVTFRAGPETSLKKLEESRELPNPSRLVFAVEDFGLLDAINLRQELAGKDDFIAAGFADQRDVNPYIQGGGLGAAVIGNYREQAIQALKLAQALVEGEESVATQVEVDTPIRVTTVKTIKPIYTYGMRGLDTDEMPDPFRPQVPIPSPSGRDQ